MAAGTRGQQSRNRGGHLAALRHREHHLERESELSLSPSYSPGIRVAIHEEMAAARRKRSQGLDASLKGKDAAKVPRSGARGGSPPAVPCPRPWAAGGFRSGR